MMDDEGLWDADLGDSEPSKKKTRILHACVNCGRKKTKCSGETPCNVCLSQGLECVYVEPKKRGPPKGYHRQKRDNNPDALRRRMQELQSQLSAMEAQSPTSPGSMAYSPMRDGLSPPAKSPFSAATVRPSPHSYVSLYTDNQYASPSSMPYRRASFDPYSAPPYGANHRSPFVGSADSPETATGPYPRRDSGQSLSARSPQNTTSLASSPEPLYYGSLSGRPQISSVRSGISGISGNSSIDASSPTAKVYSESSTYDRFSQELDLNDSVPGWIHRRLMGVYLAFIHPLWPIVSRIEIATLRADPQHEPMLFNALCALAACALNGFLDPPMDEPLEPKWTTTNLSTMFFNRAKYYATQRDLTPSFTSLQALILMALRENGFGKPAQGFQYCGMASRMAFDLGLHRKRDTSDPEMSSEQVANRTRVFWACYILDKMCAVNLGRPVFLRQEDSDVELPSSLEGPDEDLAWGEVARQFIPQATANMFTSTKQHAYSNFQALAGVCRLLEQIITRVYSFAGRNQEQSLQVLQGLHQMLETWRKQLPDDLRWEPTGGGTSRPLLPHVLAVQTWFFTARLLLFRTFIPRLPACQAMCHSAAVEICRIVENYEHAFTLRSISTSFVYATFSAAAMFAANLSCQDPEVANAAGRRLDQCIAWLDSLSGAWQAARHHARILISLRGANFADDLQDSQAVGNLVPSRSQMQAVFGGTPSSTSVLSSSVSPPPAHIMHVNGSRRPSLSPANSSAPITAAIAVQAAVPVPAPMTQFSLSEPKESDVMGNWSTLVSADPSRTWPEWFGEANYDSNLASTLSNGTIQDGLAAAAQPQIDPSMSAFWRQMPLAGPSSDLWDDFLQQYNSEPISEALPIRA